MEWWQCTGKSWKCDIEEGCNPGTHTGAPGLGKAPEHDQPVGWQCSANGAQQLTVNTEISHGGKDGGSVKTGWMSTSEGHQPDSKGGNVKKEHHSG